MADAKILIYIGNSYSFRSLSIGQIYEIAQKYPTVLLVEDYNAKNEEVLRNKKIFPKLEKIIYLKNDWRKFIKNNWAIFCEFKKIIKEEKPDIVVTFGKYLFTNTMHLRRIAKKSGAINICVLGVQSAPTKEIALWKMLMASYLKNKSLSWLKVEKRIENFFVYYILPLMILQKPFLKEPGGILLKNVFSNGCDYYLCYSEEEYGIALGEGADKEKLRMVSCGSYFSKYQNAERGNKILTIMWPPEKIGIRKSDLSKVGEEEILKNRNKILKIISHILSDWKIFLKSHPLISEEELFKLKEFAGEYSNIKFTNPLEPADDYTKISDVIVGLPPTSATSYTASVNYPEKAILCLDFEKQLLGDSCKEYNGVEYIDNEERFIYILNQIKKGEYKKNWKNEKEDNFPTISELISRL